MLKCAHCEKVYKYDSERKRHQKSHFPQFDCKVCSKKFSFLSALRRHQKQHERTGSVQCLECDGTFRDDTLLKRHMQYAHRGIFCCPECARTFSSELALHTHLKTHKPESERRFRCGHDGCAKSFNFPHHLRHHELTHTNAKQHYCNVCGKGFIQSHHLKAHIKTHSPENWIYCIASDCKKKFISKHAWKKHVGTHRHLLKPGNRVDSGISSDSSSTSEIQEKRNVGDNVLCALCGVLILRSQFASHKLDCVKSKHSNELVITRTNINIEVEPQGSTSVERGEVRPAEVANIKINHCNGKSSVILNISDSKGDTRESDTNNNDPPRGVCEGCLCGAARPRGSRDPSPPRAHPKHDDMPKIEYRRDGIIKIRETFDSDIVVAEEQMNFLNKNTTKRNELKYIPFNSCKAVLGNCIVSEDGSIGEGCLCARMVIDEQQISAQEIDELTPNPNAVWVS